jgi:hypothetical protein
MRFAYHPHEDDPQEVGWVEPILDAHGMPLVDGFVTSADDPRALRTFKAGQAFDVNEKLDPHLARFCKASPDFLTLNVGNTANLTRAGSGLGG